MGVSACAAVVAAAAAIVAPVRYSAILRAAERTDTGVAVARAVTGAASGRLTGMTTAQHRIVVVGGGQGWRDVRYLDRYGLPFMYSPSDELFRGQSGHQPV
jgi:hypothetical protein